MKLRDEWADDRYGGSCKGWLRKGTVFMIDGKRVVLSVQASFAHYSKPRENWVRLDECSEVEVALVNDDLRTTEEIRQAAHSKPRTDMYLPSQLGIEGFDDYFSSDHIAGYVPIGVVESLADELAKIGTIVG